VGEGRECLNTLAGVVYFSRENAKERKREGEETKADWLRAATTPPFLLRLFSRFRSFVFSREMPEN
jgi:hypothetical protein